MIKPLTQDQVPRPKLKRDWKGLTVRLVREIQNHDDIFDAGTLMHVRDNYGGLRLVQITKCDHCGCGEKRWINKVSESDVVIVERAP